MSKEVVTDNNKLKWYEHLACGWPLALIAMGGALGGLCGGAAYAINTKVFNKEISSTKKYVYSMLIGISSFIAYFLAVVVLAIVFPDLFSE